MYCAHCGKEVNDEAIVCTSCGCSLNTMNMNNIKYCSHCGKEVLPDAVICLNCGCAIRSIANSGNNKVVPKQELIDTVSQRIHTNGIVWIVIAVIQLLLGLTINWIFAIVGVLNLLSALSDLNFSKSYQQKPVGLVKKVKPITGAIIILIYNLFIGAVFGVGGSIYYLIAVRQYVLDNESAFLEIEQQYDI